MNPRAKKEKITTKLKAKKAKLKAKLSAKRAKLAALCLLALALCLAAGCASQPSRAQTQTIRDCTFYVMVPAGFPTNAPALALGTIGDLFTQNQVVENSGTETTSPQHTVSPTTDISVPIGTGGGSSWSSLFSGIASLFNGGTVTDATAAATAASTATAATDASP